MQRNIIYVLIAFISLSGIKLSAQTPVHEKHKHFHEKENRGILANHSERVKKLILNEEKILRGFHFGAPIDKIKSVEKIKLVTEGADFVIYQAQVGKNEFADVIYYLDEKKNLKGFGLAFPVAGKREENALFNELTHYFNERYGKFIVNDKNDRVWVSREGNYSIEMGDSTDEETEEIEIEIYPGVKI
jgi:hypothetical protein